MSLYGDSPYRVAERIERVHAAQIEALGEPGTWFTGAQRLALAEQARAARCEAGLAESLASDTAFGDGVALPEAAIRVAREVAARPQPLTRAFFEQAQAEGLSDAEYVEVVALVSRVVDYDVFARGLGIPLRPLPEPGDGEPSRERPPQAADQGAWVPTVPGGPDCVYIYGNARPQAGIISAASLVPDEARAQIALEEAQYLPLNRFMEWDYQHHEGLTRPQVEVIAGRVSDFHECFY